MGALLDMFIRGLRLLEKLFPTSGDKPVVPPVEPPVQLPVPPPPPIIPSTLQAKRLELLVAHNRFRAEVGADKLMEMAALSSVAQQQASYLARNLITNNLHGRPTGRTMEGDFKSAGIKYRIAGENAAAGQRTTVDVMADWKASRGHYANIMNPAYLYVGFGYATASTGKVYWVTMFCG